ncbi:MAG: hypothetical protein ABSH20_03530 [Tepidisphaeraceae bacterium]
MSAAPLVDVPGTRFDGFDMDGCAILGDVLVAVLLVTLVGHALWVLFAMILMIFRGMFGLGTKSGDSATRRRTTTDVLYQLYYAGQIDAATLSRVLQALGNRSVQLPPTQAPPQAALPVEAAPVAKPAELVQLPIGNQPHVPPPLPTFAPAVPIPAEEIRPVPPARPMPPPPAAPPPQPRRPLSEVLGTFMQEANIRWGELVGGLLVVGCSIALVRTFWSSIADHPWLKLGVFAAVTVAVFTVGLYTEHRWKLPTTSRAILIIASLLVPLTFLAVLVQSQGGLDTLTLLGTALAMAVFGVLLYAAGRVLTPDYSIPYAVGILGAAAAQVVLSRLSGTTPASLVLHASIPLAFYVGANGSSAFFARRNGVFDASFADRMLILLGVTTFAAIPALWHVFPHGDALPTFRILSPLFPVAAAPALAIGLMLWNRLTEPRLFSRRIAGTAILLGGVLLLAAAVVVAWPGRSAGVLCALYGLAALAVAVLTGRNTVTWLGAALLLLAVFIWPDIDHAKQTGHLLLGYGSMCMAMALMATPLPQARRALASSLSLACAIAACVAVAYTLFLLPAETHNLDRPEITLHLLWASGLWLAASLALSSGPLYGLFQVGLTLTASATFFAAGSNDPLSWAALRDVLLGIGILAPLWAASRKLLADAGLRADHPALVARADSPMPAILLGGLILLAAAAVLPGILHEFASVASTSRPYFVKEATTWCLAALVVVSIVATLRDRLAIRSDAGLMISLLGILALIAGMFAEVQASASAWRWFSAAAMLGMSVPLWMRLARPDASLKPAMLALTLTPILALTIYPAQLSLSGIHFVGPDRSTMYGHMGNAANYLIPLAVAVAVLLAHAIRDRSAGTALVSALVLNLAVSLGYALHITTSGRQFVDADLVRLLQLNFIATSVFGLLWPLILRNGDTARPGAIASSDQVPPVPSLAGVGDARTYGNSADENTAGTRCDGSTTAPVWPIVAQLAVGVVPLLVMLALGESQVLFDPASPPIIVRAIASPLGLFAAIFLGSVATWTQRRIAGRISTLSLVLILLGLGNLACFAAARHGGWMAVHMLLSARLAAPWLLLAIGWVLMHSLAMPDIAAETSPVSGPLARLLGWQRAGHNITTACTIVAILGIALSLFTQTGDPARPLWCLVGLAVAAFLAVCLAVWTLQSWFLAAMGILLNVAAGVWLVHRAPTPSLDLDFISANTITLAIGGILALGAELFILRPMRGDVVRRTRFSWHALACLLATIALGGLSAITLLGMPFRGAVFSTPVMVSFMLGSATLLAALCLYDEDAWCTTPCLYTLGLCAIIHAFDQLNARLSLAPWYLPATLAIYSVGAALLYNIRASLVDILGSIGVPRRNNWPASRPGWLAVTTIIIMVLIYVPALPVVFLGRVMLERLAMGAAAFCSSLAIGVLAAEPGRPTLKRLALTLTSLGVVLWFLSWIDPHTRATQLNWLTMAMAAFAMVTVATALIPHRLLGEEHEWTAAAKSVIPFLGAATGLCLLATFICEFINYQPAPVHPIMAWPAFLLVGAAILGLAVLSMLCAFRPEFDPLSLSDRARGKYVYAAEILFTLAFIHIRLIHPEWFSHRFFARFWPIILLAVAFTNAGVSEVLRRRLRTALAEPFTNVGGLLPMGIVAGFFFADTSLASLDLTTALLLIGAMYAALAIARESFVFSILAVLAANGALWRFLNTTQFMGFLQHPQLWLIPVAVSVLAAAYLNRRQLRPEQLSSIRYVSLIVIYLSSTADVWINRHDAAPWLPLLLAGFAVAGVLAGIALRIQSFLFMGSAFTFVAVAALIRLAARQVHSIWPWLVAGILLGAGIVVLFALFEKKRTEMLGMIGKLKEWER